MTNYLPHEIELWEIERLTANPKNARKHSTEQIQELAASMSAFGFMSAVVADSDGIVLAGNARLLAARRLGLRRVPVIVADHLSESEKQAFAQLELLRQEGMDLKLVGFSEEEFSALVDELEATNRLEDEDAAPEPPDVAVTEAGDLWELGNHRLFCGDATAEDAYQRLLDGEMAEMVFTDPPYNVDYRAPLAPDGSVRHAPITNDDLGGAFAGLMAGACRKMLDHTCGALYICMSSSELHTLYRVFSEAGGRWSTFIIWGKQTFAMGRSDYHRQFEPILYGWPEGKPHYWCGARDEADLWLIDRVHSNDLHPTMKPVELVAQAIVNSSKRDGVVLDLFGGSGTTVIACEAKGRHARLIEIEPRYCDVIVKRWQDFAGRAAIHRNSGKTFVELAEQRQPVAIAVND
jgi:DNA modification methylase